MFYISNNSYNIQASSEPDLLNVFIQLGNKQGVKNKEPKGKLGKAINNISNLIHITNKLKEK